MSAQARQRRARHRRDPLRRAVLAPRVIPPKRCVCGSSLVMHESKDGHCLAYGCKCPYYREA